jgi:hypothetical protein
MVALCQAIIFSALSWQEELTFQWDDNDSALY